MKKTLGYIILEAIMIVFGVLAGFALERYRESLADEELKMTLYKELSNDLESMLHNDVKRLEGRYESIGRSFSHIIRSIESNLIQKDSFFISIHDIEYFPKLIGNRATYNSIINSGRIDYFDQDSTFRKIQDLYGRIDLLNLVASDDSFYKTYLTPLLNQYSDRGALKFNYSSNNLIAVRPPAIEMKPFLTKEFLNITQLLKFRVELYDDVEFIKKRAEEIIQEINMITEIK